MNGEIISSVKTARRIAILLDAEIGIGKVKIGLDPIIGLLPIAGDTLTFLLSSYIVLTAFKYNLPRITKFRMVTNLIIDYIIGLIPIVGDVFDVAYKANMKNIKLLEKHLNEKQ